MDPRQAHSFQDQLILIWVIMYYPKDGLVQEIKGYELWIFLRIKITYVCSESSQS